MKQSFKTGKKALKDKFLEQIKTKWYYQILMSLGQKKKLKIFYTNTTGKSSGFQISDINFKH